MKSIKTQRFAGFASLNFTSVSGWAVLPWLFLLSVYRALISPLIGSRCRFYPSCSLYCQSALLRYGVIRGLWLTIKRLLRCHPWNPGGYDPLQ